jgi:hypothetical protein
MREKYVDERYPGLLTFNMPMVTPVNADWAVKTETVEEAQMIVAEFEKIRDALVRCAQAFDAATPEAFNAFWYGSELEKLGHSD